MAKQTWERELEGNLCNSGLDEDKLFAVSSSITTGDIRWNYWNWVQKRKKKGFLQTTLIWSLEVLAKGCCGQWKFKWVNGRPNKFMQEISALFPYPCLRIS